MGLTRGLMRLSWPLGGLVARFKEFAVDGREKAPQTVYNAEVFRKPGRWLPLKWGDV